MSQILPLENGSFKTFTYLFYPLVHTPLFSSRSPAARASKGRGWQENGGKALPGLQVKVIIGHNASCPPGFPRVHKTFLNVKSSDSSMLAKELHGLYTKQNKSAGQTAPMGFQL